MTLIALLIALLLSLGALAYVVWPLLRQGPAPVILEDDRLTELLGRKDAVMMAIKELEFDYHVGKLSEEDYGLYDGRLRRQAVGLLQQIEQVSPQSAGVDDALEAEIARRRRVAEPQAPGVRQGATAPLPVAPAVPAAALQPAGTAAVPAASAVSAAVLPAPGNGAGVRFCTNCGNRIEPNHKFCANCGVPTGG